MAEVWAGRNGAQTDEVTAIIDAVEKPRIDSSVPTLGPLEAERLAALVREAGLDDVS